MKLLTTAQAAKFLGLSYSTLLAMRRRGEGPVWIKLTQKGSYRYTKESLHAYLEDRKRDDSSLAS